MGQPQRIIVEHRHSCGCGGCFTAFFVLGVVMVASEHWQIVVPILLAALALAGAGWWLARGQRAPDRPPAPPSKTDEEITRLWLRSGD